jgi:Holliday junction DNA helicase RuvA
VARGDTARLSRIPGIGKKTAERLIMELRDKFEKAGIAAAGGGAAAARRPAGPGAAAVPLVGVAATVVAALCNLGYKPAEAERAAEQALKERPDDKVEVILRAALQSLQRG